MTTPQIDHYKRHPAAISLDEYASAERAAVRGLPARLFESYRPVVFEKFGYPTTLQDEGDLWKFIDSMQQTGTEKELGKPGGKLTAAEFDIYKRVTSYVLEFGRRHFGTSPIASYSTIRSLFLLRHIRYVFGDRPVRIFEVGPGCGYLGLVSALQRYSHASTDVTASLYILQNHLWNEFTNGMVVDRVRSGTDHMPELPAGGMLHLPWWDFVRLKPESYPKFDVFTCNHALCEMHPRAALYVIQVARRLLANSEGDGVFMFAGWGGPIANNPMGITDLFQRNGFVLIHNDPGFEGMTIFALRGTPAAKGENREVRMERSNVRRALDSTRWAWRQILHLPVPIYTFPSRHSHANPVSRACLEGRAKDASERIHGIDAVRKHYAEILGSSEPVDPDREWDMANWKGQDLVGTADYAHSRNK